MSRYIDAEMLLNRLYDKDDVQVFNVHEFNLVQRGRVAMVIDEISIADVKEVKHAHWVEIIERDSYFGFDDTTINYKCSVCSEIGIRKSKYCPSCGARMDGDDHAEIH